MVLDRLLKLTDFKTQEVTGTTHGTANTSRKFRHSGGGQVPSFWIVLEGNVYVARNGVGPQDMDVRSTNTNEQFRILAFF